ncbi:DUF4123 domain-containing protein [Pseudoxanthomonas mexicana]|uniref:DUF4123 domain-containing protein n=1 Tax=Pseudoxanthomonas mexicana TaxID=128785 RepID=UPI00398AF1C7
MPSAVDAIETFAEEIASCCDEAAGRQLFAIIDLARLDNPVDHLNRFKRIAGASNLFMGQPEASAEILAPWLLPLACAQPCQELREFLRLENQVGGVASWVMTDLPAPELASRLSHRMTASTQGKTALFRFYDPRLLGVIAQNASEAWKERFFSLGSGGWLWVEETGCLMRMELNAGDGEMVSPVPVEDNLAQALQYKSEQVQILGLLSRNWPEAWSHWPHHRRRAYVNALIDESLQGGEGDFSRKARYCRLKLARKSMPKNASWRVSVGDVA